MKVICEICNEVIAEARPGDMSVPMLGKMFRSPDAFHGYNTPFLPDTEWEDMRCGYCNQRPFTERDGFMTDKGYIRIQPYSIPEGFAGEIFTCEVCGKICKSELGLKSHGRSHEREKLC